MVAEVAYSLPLPRYCIAWFLSLSGFYRMANVPQDHSYYQTWYYTSLVRILPDRFSIANDYAVKFP